MTDSHPLTAERLKELIAEFERAKNYSHGTCGSELSCRLCPHWETLKADLLADATARAQEGECSGCGCSKWACDAYKTTGKVCCPDCKHRPSAAEAQLATLTREVEALKEESAVHQADCYHAMAKHNEVSEQLAALTQERDALKAQLNHETYLQDKVRSERDRAEAELTTLRAALAIERRAYERLNLCPDHRDKAALDRCIVCDGERRGREEGLAALAQVRQERDDLEARLESREGAWTDSLTQVRASHAEELAAAFWRGKSHGIEQARKSVELAAAHREPQPDEARASEGCGICKDGRMHRSSHPHIQAQREIVRRQREQESTCRAVPPALTGEPQPLREALELFLAYPKIREYVGSELCDKASAALSRSKSADPHAPLSSSEPNR